MNEKTRGGKKMSILLILLIIVISFWFGTLLGVMMSRSKVESLEEDNYILRRRITYLENILDIPGEHTVWR